MNFFQKSSLKEKKKNVERNKTLTKRGEIYYNFFVFVFSFSQKNIHIFHSTFASLFHDHIH